MAYLLILNGPRVDEVVALDPSATLTLGSSRDSHIQLLDPDVAPTHGRVYPAEGTYWFQDLGQGYTLLNLDLMEGSTQGLFPHDVLILGRTFVKFVLEPPAARAGAAGPSHAVKAKEAEIERLRKRLTEAQGGTSKVRRELSEAREQIEAVREEQRVERERAAAEIEKIRAAHRAERDSARTLTPLEFEPDAAADRLEQELRALRGRASELAATLAMSRAEAP